MFTETDVTELNKRLKRDGIDFKVVLSDDKKFLKVERLEFGGCEDQDGALRSVVNGYFQSGGRKVTFSEGNIR